MPENNGLKTATKTQSITNTKLMVATATLLAASGLAFAAMPYAKSKMPSVSPTSTVPIAVACTETDGGFNLAVKGTTTGSEQTGRPARRGAAGSVRQVSRTDVCTGTSTTTFGVTTTPMITEFYCANNFVSGRTVACPPGQGCAGGACAALPTSTLPIAISCVDSDGGINYTTQGSVSSTYSNGRTNFRQDTCSGNAMVFENYCSVTSTIIMELQSCANVVAVGSTCVSGACTTVATSSPARVSIYVSWSSDTPSGRTSPSAEQLIGRVAITSTGDTRSVPAILETLNVVLYFNGATSTASSTNMLQIYKNSIAPLNLLARAELNPWQPGTRYETRFTDLTFIDVEIETGMVYSFLITADTRTMRTNDALSIRVEANGVEWSDGIENGLRNANGLPLGPKTLTY